MPIVARPALRRGHLLEDPLARPGGRPLDVERRTTGLADRPGRGGPAQVLSTRTEAPAGGYAGLSAAAQGQVYAELKRFAADPLAGEKAALLRDPAVSIEDKLLLVFSQLFRELDQETEGQAQRVLDLQRGQAQGQQAQGQGQDVEVAMLELKRLGDKRDQVSAMCRGMLERYAECAKRAAESI